MAQMNYLHRTKMPVSFLAGMHKAIENSLKDLNSSDILMIRLGLRSQKVRFEKSDF
jgi:hypothetical protein